jgi:hypothetical protein
MRQSEELGELFTALSLAQGEIEDALKDATNPHFKSRYADLASVRAAYRAPFAKHGLALVQLPTCSGVKVSVQTILSHKSGQFIAETLDAAAAANTPQAIGSTITYLRRYSALGFAGIAPDDDDGNAASAKNGNGNERLSGVITDEQELQLRDMIESVCADEGKMRSFFKVGKLSDLPAAEYMNAMRMLQQKAEKQ